MRRTDSKWRGPERAKRSLSGPSRVDAVLRSAWADMFSEMFLRLRRVVATAAIAGILLGAFVGCSAAPPPDSWVMTPISYDNRMDGDDGPPEIVDATYPMALTSDTAGGFWGASAGSFLHVDAEGVAVRRFNLEAGAPTGAIAAVSPTVLVMATGERTPTYPGSVVLFDTEAMSWTDVHRDERALGDIAAHGDDVYVVAYALGEPAFTIEKLPLTSPANPVPVGPVFDGYSPVAIDVGSDGTLFVATDAERITLAADGTVQEREPVGSTNPVVSVNERGDAVWSGIVRPPGNLPSFVSGGSAEARDIIEAHVQCDPESPEFSTQGLEYLTLSTRQDSLILPFLCSPRSITWINDHELVASIGTEGGAPLVRLTPPADIQRRT